MQSVGDVLKQQLVRTGRLLGDGRGWTLLVVAAGWLSILGGRYLFPVVLPQVRRFFGVSNAAAGTAITVLWAGYALMQFPAGALTDRLGERRLLTGSLLIGATAIVAVSFAPTFWLFVVGCGLFGLGTGLYGPARGIVISRKFGEHDGTAIGVVLATGSIGSATIPLLASRFVDSIGWQPTVGMLVVPFLLVGIGVWVVVSQPPTDPDGSGPSLKLLETVRTAVTRRAVAIATTAVTLMLFVVQGLTAFLPTYLVMVKGLEQTTAAGLFSLFFLSGAVCQSLAGNAADRFGSPTVLMSVAGVSVVPLLALPFVEGPVPLGVVTVLLGSRLAINPVSNAYIIAVLPDAVQGTAWGFLRTSFFLLAATGSTVVGALFDAQLANTAIVGLAVLTAVATGLYVFLPVRTAVDSGST